MPVRIVLSQGQSSDKTIAPTLIGGLKPDRDLVADRGYDARAIIDLVEARGGRAHIPTSRDRKVQRSVDHFIYRQRNLIERFFNKLKHYRRVFARFGVVLSRDAGSLRLNRATVGHRVVLHGCTQNAALYDHGSGWSALASPQASSVQASCCSSRR